MPPQLRRQKVREDYTSTKKHGFEPAGYCGSSLKPWASSDSFTHVAPYCEAGRGEDQQMRPPNRPGGIKLLAPVVVSLLVAAAPTASGDEREEIRISPEALREAELATETAAAPDEIELGVAAEDAETAADAAEAGKLAWVIPLKISLIASLLTIMNTRIPTVRVTTAN